MSETARGAETGGEIPMGEGTRDMSKWANVPVGTQRRERAGSPTYHPERGRRTRSSRGRRTSSIGTGLTR